jgi:uncharacterized protein YutE (UPF0331/DUF86 family)
MVDASLILRKISRVRNNLSRLREKEKISLKSFKEDLDIQDIVLHNLQLAIQGCIDIGSHIISDEGWGIAGSLSEIFYILQEKGVIRGDLTEKMVSVVGFRNILIHEYDEINLNIVHDILQNHLIDIDEYLLSVVNHFRLEEI